MWGRRGRKDDQYARFVVDLVGGAEPATLAMVAVAYENLRPMLAAFENRPTPDVRMSLDQVIETMQSRIEAFKADPINARRYAWFLIAAHVTKLDRLAENTPSIRQRAVDNWIRLADAGLYIRQLLASNVVWKAEEKVWFDDVRTDLDGVRYVLTLSMPRGYRADPRAQSAASRYGFLLLP